MSNKHHARVYGVAVIGCGHMGDAHIADIFEKNNVRMVYACDINIQKAVEFQKRYCFLHITDDARECIASPEVDIVIIATYPSTHLQLLTLCLNEGKHVLLEKPICTEESEADKFVRLIQAHPSSKVLVGLILRHNESYKRIADMIHQGLIGSPMVFRMVQNHHTMDWPRYLTLIRETSPIIDCGVHYLDVMRWFSGADITDVSGIGLTTEADVPEGKYNYGMITVRLEDGSTGYYEAGWGNSISSEDLKEFVGPKGRIRLIQQKDRTSHGEEGDLIEYYNSETRTYQMINVLCKRKPTGDQLEHLIRMIEEDVPPVPSMEEVMESFRWALEADRSIYESLAQNTGKRGKSNEYSGDRLSS